MKKYLLMAIAASFCFILFGCSSNAEPEDNDIAKSMTYPKTFDEISYNVAGDWEEIVAEDQITYNTGYSQIMISATKKDDVEALVSSMLAELGVVEDGSASEKRAPEAPEGSDVEQPENANVKEAEVVEEEIEINGISGTKKKSTIAGKTCEVFTLFAKDKAYCIVSVYDDMVDQNKAYEAIDTLLTSVMFTGEQDQSLQN